MKKFIALAIFAIGMLVIWPPGEQVKAANSDQVSFVIDQQYVAPAAAMLQDNYTFDQVGNVKYQNVINCRKGGGVEVQVLNPATQPTYLINNKMKAHNFTDYSNYSLRTCLTDKTLKGQNLQAKNKVSVGKIRIRSDTEVS